MVLRGGCLCTQNQKAWVWSLQGQRVSRGVISVGWVSPVWHMVSSPQKPRPRPAAGRLGRGGSRPAWASPVRIPVHRPGEVSEEASWRGLEYAGKVCVRGNMAGRCVQVQSDGQLRGRSSLLHRLPGGSPGARWYPATGCHAGKLPWTLPPVVTWATGGSWHLERARQDLGSAQSEPCGPGVQSRSS